MTRLLPICLVTLAIAATSGCPAQPGAVALTPGGRLTLIDSIGSALKGRYVFPDVAAKMDTDLRERAKRGEFDAITDASSFAQVLTKDLQALSHDKHVRVRVGGPGPGGGPPSSADGPTGAFGRSERLAGDVAYIEILSFGFPPEAIREETSRIMSEAADAKALILDLRKNGGGSPFAVALVASYVFGDKPVLINSLYFRPANRTDDFYTDPAVSGKKFGPTKPVYVLISSRTFSGAEEFAYDLQTQKRATIVGETTGGGANPGGPVPLPYGLTLFVPTGRAINPITRTNWEGVGVKPDVAVSADSALDVAHSLARKVVSAPAHAQAAQFPSTPAGQQLSQLLAAFNTGDRDTMRKYLEVNFPERLSKLDEDLRFRQGTGGFDFKTVEDSKPLRLVSIVKEKNSDQFARATLQVEEGPAHRVTDFNLQAIPTPPEFVVAQGPEVADSPAERQFRAWLAVFSEGDRAALLKFFTDNYPSEVARIDGDLNFRQGTGGFDFRKAVSATATQFTALVQERGSDQFARAVVTVEPNEPHRILSVGLRAIPRPPEFAIPRLTEAELVQQLGSKLKEDAKNGLFAGAVLVARQGKPVFTGAYGMANRETAQPNKLTTRFRMGSMNKMFTATAIMQLLQAGKIKLDDPLGKFLTDYPNKDVASKVTIHHLLTHTGGTGDIFGPEFDSHRLQLRTLNDYITLYGSRGLAFEPGKQWDYSNYGFILLGAIVERVSGQSYYDYVRDHIFVPAGMTRTASEPEDVAVPDRATGYMRDGSSSKPNTETLPYRGTSAGGGYTTVEDLLRFANALTQHKLLNENYTQLLTTAKPETGDAHYAYGFEDDVVRGVRSFGHSGGAPGMNGDLLIFPQTGYVVVALANMDRGAQREASWISERLPAQ